MPARSRPTQPDPVPAWSRQRMLLLLVAAVVAVLVLLSGLVVAVVDVIRPPQHRDAARHPSSAIARSGAVASDASKTVTDPRDALAARPMPSVPDDAAHPGPVSTATPGPAIALPPPTRTGPAGVATGFPHTPAGALAQLAAIDQSALQSGSLADARAVITGWAQPGGPTATSWSLIAGLVTLFDETGLSGGGSPQLAIVLTPVMGLIKGAVGTDYVVACVDFELDITLTQTARGAVADCQRMVWTPTPTPTPTATTTTTVPGAARWMIGPGAEPTTPPSVWPDTDTAIAVGYHDLRTEPAR